MGPRTPVGRLTLNNPLKSGPVPACLKKIEEKESRSRDRERLRNRRHFLYDISGIRVVSPHLQPNSWTVLPFRESRIFVISLSCSPQLLQHGTVCFCRVSVMAHHAEQAGACSTLSHR
ncbi:MAG: hypothetical protein QOC84_2246 [Bradyrhizobium sp.]|nr:hypothetical protein [Bradyrhizobium sp.]